MESKTHSLFTSERLGFREWSISDLAVMAEMNSDPQVMEFFPCTQSEKETQEFIDRMKLHFSEKGFCYFAVDLLENNDLIGFIGLLEKDPATLGLEPALTPFIDIGWRLKSSAWNKGYATEGAKRCLDYGFQNLGLKKISSLAPRVNVKSELVMKKIGMQKIKHFNHALLKGDERLEECVLYEIHSV